MKSTKKIIVIVDPYSSGMNIAPAFCGEGYSCILIETNPIVYSNKYSDCFIEKIKLTSENDIDSLVKKLKKYDIKAIIAASEFGVNVADRLADNFDIEKNDARTTMARRDKYLMIDALNNSQGKIIGHKQYKSSNLQDLLTWFENSKLKKIILKPCLAALSYGVFICRNSQDITNAYNANHGKPNVLGIVENECVLQEFLEGNEYIVNSVSCRKKHFITDIWVGVGGTKDKISTDKYARLISKKEKEFKILSEYTYHVLDALGIQNGAAHSEIKLTEQGPKLIECGARLAGGADFSVMNEAQGFSQLSLTLHQVISPDLFDRYCRFYEKNNCKSVWFVYLCSEVSGKIFSEPDLEPLMHLPSLHSISCNLKPGDILLKTDETIGRPGYAFFIADSNEEIERDYAKFRSLENQMYLKMLNKK